MNGQLSVGESICQDFGRYLKSLEAEGRCIFLPFEIQSLHLRGIGKFSEKHLDLADVTIIHGNNGTGKSTVIKSVSSVSGSQIKVKSGENSGQINMILSDCSVLRQDVFNAENIRCIILDDAGERLDQERYCEFLHYLRDLNTQLILFTGNMDEERERLFNQVFPICRFIDLN